MQLLLDTHVFLWAAGEPERLSGEARDAIEDMSNVVLVSAAVAWELAIKVALQKLTVPNDVALWLPTRLRSLGFGALDITMTHTLAVGGLPALHKDPFDRIMIAQAQIEGLTFVTHDPQNLKYPIRLLPT